jgi:UDP-N-acetylglucosamine 2-epimerase (non-hydrolysing)
VFERDDTMKKILVVFGTRPEAVKMAPLVMELKKYPKDFETLVCVTAQHREMLDQVLDIFGIDPDIDLDIMKEGQDLTDVTTRVLMGMRVVLQKVHPDLVLVHGDTTTSSATALAAYYQQIPVGHVEAGLRTNNIYSPWPEEMNRQITGRISTWHYAPTALSRQNLLKENVSPEKILVTGNTVIDALHIVLNKISKTKGIQQKIEKELNEFGLPVDLLKSWNGYESERKMILITGHRRENFGEGFINICEAIRELSCLLPDYDFVYPMHLNPNVRKPILDVFGTKESRNLKNVFFIEPIQYLPFVYLMSKCAIILTDSGGIQEEAPALGKPVLVMRNTTERPEALEAGTVKLVGTDKSLIVREILLLAKNREAYNLMAKAQNPYGDGKACNRIVQKLKTSLE